jgi:hypothetical protein
MRLAFPGMDPWLEDPTIWPGFHNWLIAAIADDLAPRLAPRYFVALESRTTVLTGLDLDLFYRPDFAVHAMERVETRRGAGIAVVERPEIQQFAIQEVPGRKLVTVLEILSPTNKKTANARADYLKKRQALIRSRVNFVEIDLLRGGEPMPLENSPSGFDYRILVCRAPAGSRGVLFPFMCTSPIPPIPIPLLPGDAEPILDLHAVTHSLIDRASYDLVIDYTQPPDPPLRPADEAWAAAIVAESLADHGEETRTEGATP